MAVLFTTNKFLETLEKSALVDSHLLQTYLAALQAAAPLPEQARPVAARLVRDGLLTRFQAQQLLLGRHRGFLIGGKYKLLDVLGKGGMGKVFLCEHVRLRRKVALKVLPSKHLNSPGALARFEREGQAIASLNHPNIVRVHDIDQEKRHHFLVMEFVDGVSLQYLVGRRGPLTISQAAHYISQAAQGLQHAHQIGWVHRDIKPGNILLDREGTVKILDMGLARCFSDQSDHLTSKFNGQAVLGTADYVAPEQALNCHDADIRSDLYSLGATLFFLLTGSPPFNKGTVAHRLLCHQMQALPAIEKLRPEVPPELFAVVARMMAKDRSQRYQTPAEVVEALAPWTATPLAPPSAEDIPPFNQRNSSSRRSSSSAKPSSRKVRTIRSGQLSRAAAHRQAAIQTDGPGPLSTGPLDDVRSAPPPAAKPADPGPLMAALSQRRRQQQLVMMATAVLAVGVCLACWRLTASTVRALPSRDPAAPADFSPPPREGVQPPANNSKQPGQN
jgi:serine/threonine protein kinase